MVGKDQREKEGSYVRRFRRGDAGHHQDLWQCGGPTGGVDLDLRQGEILALLGENGSGKTTLMNMLSGIYAPDSGSIRVGGRPVTISSPQDAKRLGIGMVHQHFKLVDVLSAADNIWMGAEKVGPLLRRDRYDKIAEVARRFGFDIDPRKQVAQHGRVGKADPGDHQGALLRGQGDHPGRAHRRAHRAGRSTSSSPCCAG